MQFLLTLYVCIIKFVQCETRLEACKTLTIRALPRENLSSGFLARSDTNRALKPKKMARGLKFWI